MADTPEAIRAHFKQYAIVGIGLFFATGLTVAVATIPALDIGAHGFDYQDMILGFAIAFTKMFFVALIFMHLNSEKKWVYFIFFGSLVFGAILIALFALAMFDPITFKTLLPLAPAQ